MAVPSDLEPHKSNSGRKILSPEEHVAVRLYADGRTRSDVARLLAERANEPEEIKAYRKRLRAWEETQWFRDAVYDYAVQKLDMTVPKIFNGLANRARRGRVDASRLVLEVTGRHNPRGEAQTPAVIQISFGGSLPRPNNRPQLDSADSVDGEVLAEDEEEPNGP